MIANNVDYHNNIFILLYFFIFCRYHHTWIKTAALSCIAMRFASLNLLNALRAK